MVIYRVIVDNDNCILGCCDEIKMNSACDAFSSIKKVAKNRYWGLLETGISINNLKQRVSYWKTLLSMCGNWTVEVLK